MHYQWQPPTLSLSESIYINSQIETDSSIHTSARSKDILEISTHLSFAKFREELSEMRRDAPHTSALIGKDDRLDGIRILSGPPHVKWAVTAVRN
ncbi:hypothetical protein CDAR_365061 [Caerostris darwini]|uniref:Uncharacterized protein n=1 Tax=Caerostris darwini TaxID=1538125 RepID=A0AAV4S7M1_9ARAC|nr:hypothetical protein CDAR_365061 [Caerostris darwini]